MDGTYHQFHTNLSDSLPGHGNAPVIGTVVNHEQLEGKAAKNCQRLDDKCTLGMYVDDENIKYFMVPISDEAEIFFLFMWCSVRPGVNILSRDLLDRS